jgi:hypothetical protein
MSFPRGSVRRGVSGTHRWPRGASADFAATRIRKFFGLSKEDDVRKFVIRREVTAKNGKVNVVSFKSIVV